MPHRFFANAWGLGDALNKVNDATRKVQVVTQGVQDSAQGTQAAVQGAKDVPQAAASAVTGQAAALPWPMEKLSDWGLREKVKEYLKDLGSGEGDEYGAERGLSPAQLSSTLVSLVWLRVSAAGWPSQPLLLSLWFLPVPWVSLWALLLPLRRVLP